MLGLFYLAVSVRDNISGCTVARDMASLAVGISGNSARITSNSLLAGPGETLELEPSGEFG
jgi:hypothetical protein